MHAYAWSSMKHVQRTALIGSVVLHCLLHMPSVTFAMETAGSTEKVRISGESWSMCSKHCIS